MPKTVARMIVEKEITKRILERQIWLQRVESRKWNIEIWSIVKEIIEIHITGIKLIYCGE